MADFAVFALRYADGTGGEEALAAVEGIFHRMQDEQKRFTLEGEAIVDLLQAWIEDVGNRGRAVDASTLHRELSAIAARDGVAFDCGGAIALGRKLASWTRGLGCLFRMEIRHDKHLKKSTYEFSPADERGGVAGHAV